MPRAATTYAYDADGRMASRTDPLGGPRLKYDASASRSARRTARSAADTVTWTYDGAGRQLAHAIA
jgi:uncharacterized protein RhaS with RHS repeats